MHYHWNGIKFREGTLRLRYTPNKMYRIAITPMLCLHGGEHGVFTDNYIFIIDQEVWFDCNKCG